MSDRRSAIYRLALLPFLVSGLLTSGVEGASRGSPGPEALAEYVSFLRGHAADPVEYVLGLFEAHDLVVLCERWHPETTQYELITRIVSHPRFAERVGVVFTELGARNLQAKLEAILATPDLDREAVGRRLVPIFRDLGLHPFWHNTNFFDFLRDVYELDQSRPAELRVRVLFTDLPIDWEGMTPEGYARYFEEQVKRRDRAIADRIIAAVREMDAEGPTPAKALVIMNYRHAFNDFEFADGSRGDNVGRYLFEAFPGRVANVMINSVALLPGTTDSEVVAEPIQAGRWDAAFRVAGIGEAGFDFAGSPFGQDRFDYFPFREHDTSYEDVFDGFVFYRPLVEHRLAEGIPGMFDDDFEVEVRRRFAVTGRTIDEESLAELRSAAEKPMVEPYEEAEAFEAAIAHWLGEPPRDDP